MSNNVIIINVKSSNVSSADIIFKDKIVFIFKWYFWFLSTFKFIHSLFSKLFAYNIQWISQIIIIKNTIAFKLSTIYKAVIIYVNNVMFLNYQF